MRLKARVPPCLSRTGAAGGFDQRLSLVAPLASQGSQIVALSRDGYLGSPLAPSSSPQSQADRYAALLDTLGLGNCAILGVSVGGPSAIAFALRHPHHCRALLLVSSIVEAARPAYLGAVPGAFVLPHPEKPDLPPYAAAHA